MQPDLIPNSDRILGWIQTIFSKGIRRPGYPADRSTEEFVAAEFRRMGLQNVRAEPVKVHKWEPRRWSLQVTGPGGDMDIPCFPLPHSAPTEGIEAELVAFDRAKPSGVKGKAAFDEVRMMEIPTTGPVTGGAAFEEAMKDSLLKPTPGGRLLDPRNTLQNARQIVPLPPQIQHVMEPAMDAEAVLYIGCLTDYPGNGYKYYVPYDGVERDIPGVWIRHSDGERLKTKMSQGPVQVWLQVDSVREEIESFNIVGELPGADDDILLIGSHHDGPWSSAVEDASGVALVLAQAAYWTQVPQGERPHHMMFLLTAAHMAGGAGSKSFVADHAEELERTVLEIHLEHAANEFVERDGRLVATGEPEPRWFFTSRIPELEEAMAEILTAEEIDRALIIRPDALGPRPTTDGGAFHLAGVPLVNYLTAPFYLFDPIDTMDKIHVPSLEPITRATVRLAEWTAGRSAKQMRADVIADGA